MIKCAVAALAILFATPVLALDLLPSNAVITRAQDDPAGSARIPTSPWTGTPTALSEGRINRKAARIPQPELTTLQLIQPLRQKLQDDGYVEVFSCADAPCGGFDFRFQLDLLPAPDMYVDLGDYRYLVMEKATGEPHSVSIMASRSRTDGFVHITEISAASFPDPERITSTTQSVDTPDPTGIIAPLIQAGHAILPDLVFAVGSAELGTGPFQSLQALSLWLEDNANARIVLVGHTDAVGSLDANTSLSRRRALSVAQRLTSIYGANATQIDAAGAGYLSPVASNLTEEGRAINRRVEVVLLSLN